MRSRPEKEKSAIVISGFVSVTIQEITDALGDPYTYYMTAEEYQRFQDSLSDTAVVGIGVMAGYSKERPELELESFFRSLYPSTRRGIRENWLRLQEDPDDTMGIWEIDLIWIRLYLELMAERPDLEPLFNEPRDLSRFPEKGGARMCPSTRFLRFLTREDLLLDEEMSQHFEDCQKWDAMYPEEAKERKMRRLRKMGGKE